MTPAADAELERLLAPALATIDRLPPELRAAILDGVQSVGCVLDLAAAQANAAETRAVDAREASDAMAARAAAMSREVTAAMRWERARWEAVVEFIEKDPAPPDEAQTDRLVRMLDVHGPVGSSAEFDVYMADDELALSLGPGSDRVGEDTTQRLALIARTVARAPLADQETQRLLAETDDGSTLHNSATCGVVCAGASLDRQLVLIGDGTALSLVDDHVERVTPTASELADFSPLAAHRWVTGAPPVLLPHTRAALALCLEARSAAVPVNAHAFGPWTMLGAALTVAGARPDKLRLARAIRDVLTVARAGLTPALLRLVYETMRVTVYRTGDSLPAGTRQRERSVIDVGRVRWCELSRRPVVWLPLVDRNPDLVGGGDRPWTSDPPAAGATWHAESPGLRVDQDWHARIVLLAGSPNLWALTPDGAWWSLQSDFEAVVLARREHVEPWLDALEVLDEELPARIEALDAVAARSREAADLGRTPRPELPPPE